MKAVWKLALVLGLCIVAPSCASPVGSRDDLITADQSFDGRIALRSLAERDSLYDTDGLTARAGLEPIGHHDAIVAIWVFACFVLVFVVFVDLILLPFSYRRHHLWFPCCRYVIHRCR
jgi:hypothetical protein